MALYLIYKTILLHLEKNQPDREAKTLFPFLASVAANF